eukprot:Nk52_evm1s1441 gene=Nk52_evmTU1s1441
MTVLVLMLMSPQLAAGNPDLHGKYYVTEWYENGHVECAGYEEPDCRGTPTLKLKSPSKLQEYSPQKPLSSIYTSSLLLKEYFKIIKINKALVEWEVLYETYSLIDFLSGACSKEKRHFSPLCQAKLKSFTDG